MAQCLCTVERRFSRERLTLLAIQNGREYNPSKCRLARSAYSADQEAALRRLLNHFPEAASRLEARIRALLNQLSGSLSGAISTEEQADYVLASLADRVVADTAPETDQWGLEDELRGAATYLLARHFIARARDDFVRRLLASRRN